MRLPKQTHFSVAVKPHNVKLMAGAHTNQKQCTKRTSRRASKKDKIVEKRYRNNQRNTHVHGKTY